jgi:hypothetical protein
MKQAAHWFSNLDLLKQKVQTQGSVTGFCLSFVFFLGCIAILIYVILNSYVPQGVVPGLGFSNKTTVQFDSLNLKPRSFPAYIKCTDPNGCLVVPLKKKQNQPTIDPNCEKIEIITEKEITICYGYTYNFFQKNPIRNGNIFQFLYFEGDHFFLLENGGKSDFFS